MSEPIEFSPPGLGAIEILAPAGKLSLTPATQMAVNTIASHRDLLRGKGIDWGSGSGVLAIVAARIGAVESVLGLELAVEDVELAQENARRNGVADKVQFLHADSFTPLEPDDLSPLTDLLDTTDFLIANPPASRGDDGLGWRRSVLRGARHFVRPGAPLLIQISYQYNVDRIARLAEDVQGYSYEGVIGSSEWIAFDQSRSDLSAQLVEYAEEETAGGTVYTFAPAGGGAGHVSAIDALNHYRMTGESPISKWQMHLFRRG